MQTGKKGLALLLALLMVFSLLPVSALAADGCLTTTSAGKAFSTKQGELLTVGLAQYFTDGDGHTLTYSLDAGDYGTQTKIAKDKDGNDVLSFTNPDTGEYTPTITAKCSGGETASVKLTITVTEGEKGDERQYGYDETPADSVTVYVTVSSDGMPLRGNDGTVLSHLEVKVPYFDLGNQGLADFYRYHTENGSGAYVDSEIVQRPTALHLYLYMIGKYYLGFTEEGIKNGTEKVYGADGGQGVEFMGGGEAYTDDKLALNITGSATSMYMQQFWGHDENLMYYRNHVYPLMGPGWGSTADYILLSDGDTIDVAMFSNWSFWQTGAFAAFEQDSFTVAKGNTLTAHTLKYDTQSVADGGTEEFEPITGLTVAVYDADWEHVADMDLSGDEDNAYSYTFNEAGTYYLLGLDPNAGVTGAESAAQYAPATAKVTVTDGSSKPAFDPAEWYKDFDFSCISLDAEGTDYVYNIEESSMYVQHFNNAGDKKLYTVTVPAGTDFVYVNYPADFDQNIVEYCALFESSGEVVGFSCDGYEVLDNAEGGKTLKLPASYLVGEGKYFAAENSSYDYFNCFYFKEGDNTPPSTGDDAKVTGVKLDQNTLTVERGNTAQLTATVEPDTANNKNVTWQSSNMKVATVTRKGVVNALAEGTTTVTVTTADGGYTAKCTVTVTDPNKPAVAADGYYEIANGAQLQWFANEVNASKDNAALNARLTDDIDLSGICSSANPWTPIGDHANNRIYSGTFDGQGHKITGLYLKGNASNYTNGNTYYIGLFGECDGVTIKNLSVYGTAMAVTRMVGGLAGRTCGVSTHRRSTVENCHNYVTLTGSATNDDIFSHGGLVGSAQETDFIGCSNEVDITGYQGQVGGIVGNTGIGGVTLTNCWNNGHVHLRGYKSTFEGVGGLVGSGSNTLTLTNCYNTGAVDFFYRTAAYKQYVGGLVGCFGGTGSGTLTLTMTGCYSTGKISGDKADEALMGGLLGGMKNSGRNTVEAIAVHSYYLEGTAETSGVLAGALAFNAKGGLTAAELGDSESTVWKDSCPYPVLTGQTVTEHTYADGVCSACGKIEACQHETTEPSYRRHTPNDGKFDEVTVCTVCLKAVNGTVTEHLYGDADGNGSVNSTDLAVVYGVINGKRELTGAQSFAADVNADGKIDGLDALILDTLINQSKFAQTELPLDVAAWYSTNNDGTHKIMFTYGDSTITGTGTCADADGDDRCDICKGCLHPEASRKTEYRAHFTSDGKYDELISCTKCYVIFKTIEHLIGDVNNNGEVDVSDAMAMNALLNKAELTDAERLSADLNNDGTVDEIDTLLVSQVYLGNIAQTSLPVKTTLTYTPAEEDEHTVTVSVGEQTIKTSKEACADTDGDGKCDKCGDAMIVVPTRKEGYPAETSATVQTGMAYLLSDLQAGKVFAPADGQTLGYKNYYYERSTDGGETWDAKVGFSEAIFGMTTIQITENTAGTYVYRFYASHDGVHFSKDTWTLTLTVEEAPKLNFSFFVGKDYTGDYPVIKLYNVTTDEEGNEVFGDEITDVFLYSDFTSTLPEGETEYDPAQGKLVSNYQMFYASLTAGRYAYRAFAKNADTGEYDVALGGMTLNLPTDSNVDGGAGGGTNIYLQCNSFYVTSKKTDNTYFTADEYHVRLDCPIMGTSAVMGTPYVSGNYTYYPTVLYAAGNACLYNAYAYPDIDGYIFTQTINQTFRAGYSASTKSLSINTAIVLTVTVPQDATFGLYFQWNNFNTTEVEPDGFWKDNEDGTKYAQYTISKGNGNYTWRLSDDTHVTQAGWLASQNASADLSFSFDENAATNRVSHSFAQLGTQTAKRDEADLQVNLDPSGYEAISGTTRVRAYRHWQLINSDAGNIMVEPDFHWNLETGDASIQTVNGGNTTANWADVTPGAEDSIITVYYDSVDVNHGSYGTHGGYYPATQPQRIGVIVVGGTGVTHGTADADVDFNMAPGTTTTRSMDWDYNYDTWFYGANETDPALDFAVTAAGTVTVEYAFVTADNAMNRIRTEFAAIEAGEDGRYTVPLAKFGEIGNGMGGTVIIKMTDDTGVSYRLVRVAKVTITAENVSHPEEDIMPGDQVKLTFSGMFRAVNKISGIFNPTMFKPTYYAGETKYEGTLGQYQKMDNASVTVTIPTDVEFAEGAETATYSFTNGYTFGSMYSAANPFAFLYNMTDAGVGTNFNAVTVTYYMNHYADAAVEVHRKVTYDTKLVVPDASDNEVEGVKITLTGADGAAIETNENGRYTLGYGDYTYVLTKDGYVVTRGTFSLGSADAEKVGEDGILTVTTAAMLAAGENAWDGTTKTEPSKDADGVYQIGTASELAWFGANGGSASAVLTADIELAGYDWTPMSKLYGSFNGDGHTIRNLYINSTSYPVGLFGYVKTGASVTKLGITGNVATTNKSYGQAGGIAGYLEDNAPITQCWSSVNVTAGKYGGGIAGYSDSSSVITDCYATGTIRTISANECYLGGICGSYYNQYAGATLTNCYSTATVIGTGGNASYVGGLSPVSNEKYFVNSYYLEGAVSGASPKYGVTGLGTAKTADELKALAATLGESFAEDTDGINGGYPILAWQSNDPAKDTEGFYLISTVEEMQWLAEKVNGGTTDVKAKLVNDIDLSSITWTPIGTKDVPFSGVFDGDGHTVNLVINKSGSDSYQALFGYMKGENAEIRNLAVTGSVKSTGTRAGTGAQFNAGILGYAESGTVKNCYNAADISGRQNIGGVVGGGDTAAVIDNCYNSGSVTATGNFAGGITSSYSTWGQGPTLSNCYNSGTVTAKLTNGGTRRIGGIACIQAPNKSYGENLYYLDTCLGDETGEGAAESKTLPELIKLVEAKTEHPFTEPMLAALKALLGDVNADGKVDVTDAELVYNYSIGAGELTEAQILLADMDGDGYITAKDAAMIYAIIAAALAGVTE